MTDTPQVLLQHHLKKLRLPTFHSEYAKQARQCAVENKDHINYLLRLCELELIERERRMIERRIKAAKFPATKSLDSFNFKVIPSLNKVLTMGRVASITGQARSTLTRENGQPTDSNLAQPSSVILLRARTPICASVF